MTDIDFKNFYINWHNRAVKFAQYYVLVEEDAENIVQDVFMRIYERLEDFDRATFLGSYLFTAIKNECLKTLQHRIAKQKAMSDYRSDYVLPMQLKYDSLEVMDTNFRDEQSIEELLQHAIDSLPEKCRQIFVMHKLEGKKQKEVAEALGISESTVQVQMGIAYRKLRKELKDCMPLFIFLFL